MNGYSYSVDVIKLNDVSQFILLPILSLHCTQKKKFSIKYFFSKCDQIRSFLRIWSHLLKKSLMENFIFCALLDTKVINDNLIKVDVFINMTLEALEEKIRTLEMEGKIVNKKFDNAGSFYTLLSG